MNCASECQVQRADLSQSYLIWKNIVGCVVLTHRLGGFLQVDASLSRSVTHQREVNLMNHLGLPCTATFLWCSIASALLFPCSSGEIHSKTRSFPCSFTKSPVPPFSRLARGDLLGFASANLYFSNILLDCHDFVRSRHRSIVLADWIDLPRYPIALRKDFYPLMLATGVG